MNADLTNEHRHALTPWTRRLPPAFDDPAYTLRYRSLVKRGIHPAVAAVMASENPARYAPPRRVA